MKAMYFQQSNYCQNLDTIDQLAKIWGGKQWRHGNSQ